MKSPFRAIRQKLFTEGKLVRYLGYAVGEILLIIIGIMIALELNNWNEDRKAQAEFDEYIVQLKKDVREAIEDAENSITFMENRISSVAAIFPLLQEEKIQAEQLAVLESGLSSLGKYIEIQVHVGLLGQILNGDMGAIGRDKELVRQALVLESNVKQRMGYIDHIYDKLNLADQYLLEFRGDKVEELEMEILYDFDELKSSKKFQYTSQQIIRRTYGLASWYRDIKNYMESFLAVLKEYE